MIDNIRANANELTARDLILFVVSIAPFLLGWLIGFMTRAALWLVASFVAGYQAGRGQ